jgi:hypothetical protein
MVRNLLDVEETPVGLEADLPQRGQVLQQFADAKVASIVDSGLSLATELNSLLPTAT